MALISQSSQQLPVKQATSTKVGQGQPLQDNQSNHAVTVLSQLKDAFGSLITTSKWVDSTQVSGHSRTASSSRAHFPVKQLGKETQFERMSVFTSRAVDLSAIAKDMKTVSKDTAVALRTKAEKALMAMSTSMLQRLMDPTALTKAEIQDFKKGLQNTAVLLSVMNRCSNISENPYSGASNMPLYNTLVLLADNVVSPRVLTQTDIQIQPLIRSMDDLKALKLDAVSNMVGPQIVGEELHGVITSLKLFPVPKTENEKAINKQIKALQNVSVEDVVKNSETIRKALTSIASFFNKNSDTVSLFNRSALSALNVEVALNLHKTQSDILANSKKTTDVADVKAGLKVLETYQKQLDAADLKLQKALVASLKVPSFAAVSLKETPPKEASKNDVKQVKDLFEAMQKALKDAKGTPFVFERREEYAKKIVAFQEACANFGNQVLQVYRKALPAATIQALQKNIAECRVFTDQLTSIGVNVAQSSSKSTQSFLDEVVINNSPLALPTVLTLAHEQVEKSAQQRELFLAEDAKASAKASYVPQLTTQQWQQLPEVSQKILDEIQSSEISFQKGLPQLKTHLETMQKSFKSSSHEYTVIQTTLNQLEVVLKFSQLFLAQIDIQTKAEVPKGQAILDALQNQLLSSDNLKALAHFAVSYTELVPLFNKFPKQQASTMANLAIQPVQRGMRYGTLIASLDDKTQDVVKKQAKEGTPSADLVKTGAAFKELFDSVTGQTFFLNSASKFTEAAAPAA